MYACLGHLYNEIERISCEEVMTISQPGFENGVRPANCNNLKHYKIRESLGLQTLMF